jgi:hypothetical protein
VAGATPSPHLPCPSTRRDAFSCCGIAQVARDEQQRSFWQQILRCSFSRSVADEERFEKGFTRTEIRLPQAVEGGWKISQTVLRRVCKHAQGSQDGKATAFRFATPVPFVNEQGVGGKFLGERDSGPFASSETLVQSNEFTCGACSRTQSGGLAIQRWTMSGVCS